MADTAQLPPTPKRRRGFKIETRFGGARELKSRKDRPCDACRKRKTACVILTQPPCRFCENRNLPCSFVCEPKPRIRPPPRPKTTSRQESKHARRVSDASSQFSAVDALSACHEHQSITPPTPLSSSPPQTHPAKNGLEILSPVSMLSVSDQEHAAASSFTGPLVSNTDTVLAAASIPPNTYPQAQAFPFLPEKGPVGPPPAVVEGNFHNAGTLDGIPGLTAHFMGISGEQDANLLSSFRSNILNETNYVDVNIFQVEPGNPTQGIPPVHFSMVHDWFPERDHQAKLIASTGIEGLVGEHADELVKLYFQFVHPAFPVLSKGRFLEQYLQDKYQIPPSLRGAVYGLASSFFNHDGALASGPINQHGIFEHVHSSLNRELESPKLSTLQACLLVLHEQPAENGTTESPKVWAFAGQAIACAQVLGLHRDPTLWEIPEWEKRLRRKLWWATYFTDRWTSICHGNPPHIHNESFDTKDIEVEDITAGEDVTELQCPHHLIRQEDQTISISLAVRFTERIKLTKLLDNVLGCSYTFAGYRDAIQDYETVQRSLLRCQTALHNWHSLLPQCLGLSFATNEPDHSINGSLHLSFYAAEILLFRALMTPANVHSKITPSSSLRRHFDHALARLRSFVQFMGNLRKHDLSAFWGRHARTNFVICANFLIYLFLCAFTPDRVTATYSMLETFHNSLKTLTSSTTTTTTTATTATTATGDMVDETTISLLRPAVLRIDSFFGQAVEIMRAQSSEVVPVTSSSVVLAAEQQQQQQEQQAQVCQWGSVVN